jgi:adenine-specific DNA-methyltransferase
MRSRIRALHPLLSESGTLFAEIDDTELGSLLQLLDEEFGRDNRVSLVTIVRSAATGHKARNRGPVNVTDFLLVYAKHRPSWRCKALVRPRETYDAAYNTFLDNREDPPEDWRFLPLGKKFALEAGFPDAHAARKAKGSGYKAALTAFALRHARSVVRFAQPRFEAISHDAQRLVEKSKSNPTATFVLPRSKHPPMFLRGGNRILFLSDKVQTTDDGLTLVEPLTNVWDDIPFQGIAREGGVTFSRNKKPEKLLARILDMATEPGDLVLDPFLGSGTTAAVAHKLGRRWLGVENGPHIDTLCLPRLRSVIDGVDETGVSRVVGWQGGGEFAVYTL